MSGLTVQEVMPSEEEIKRRLGQDEVLAPLPRPTSGLELARMLDVDLDEGVVLFVFPETIEEVVTKEAPYLDKKGKPVHVVCANLLGTGQRAIDVVSPSGSPIRWWQAREAARVAGITEATPRYEGPIGEIPERYFTAGYVVGIRFYKHGPIFFPLEQPTIAKEEAINDVIADAVEGVCGST
jgi:hypothetical protein